MSNGLTFDTAEVNRFFLRVVLDNLDDREPINAGEVGISTFLIDKKKQATEDNLVRTKPGAHFLFQHVSYLIS